jgi:hypothetical protein
MIGIHGKNTASTGVQAFGAAALLGTCGLIWALGSIDGSQAEQRAAEPHRHMLAISDQTIRDCQRVAASATFDCLRAQVEAGSMAARADQDLVAQQRLSLAAAYAAIAALVTAAIAATGLWYLRETLATWRVSVAETRRIGEAQVRCYLSVAKVVIDFTDHRAPLISCKIVNSGQSPALATTWRTRLVYDDGETPSESALYAPCEPRDGITISAKDSAIPTDIDVFHDLSAGLRRIQDGGDVMLFCVIGSPHATCSGRWWTSPRVSSRSWMRGFSRIRSCGSSLMAERYTRSPSPRP